jgi:8-oxo-dGTP diphosphatase
MTRKLSRPAANHRSDEKPLLVVAALIASEGRVLACQRHRTDAFGLRWEFPGGKVRPHEKLQEALVRELQEELGVAAEIGDEVHRTRHRYAEMAREIELIFFTARAESSGVQNRVFEQIRWVAPANLASLDFLPADRELIRLLSSGKLKIS